MSEEAVKTETKTKKQTEYSKEQLLRSSKYKNRQDLLSVLLENGKYYSIAAVDKLIENFMKGKVN